MTLYYQCPFMEENILHLKEFLVSVQKQKQKK